MSAMERIRRLYPEDWKTLRDLRLAALADAPSAFGGTYAQSADHTREEWVNRLRQPTTAFFVADHDDRPVGIVGGLIKDGEPDAHLMSMWVAPPARGRRLGIALIDAVVAWARERDAPRLRLWVSEPNDDARALYRRHGFTDTGESEPLLSDPSITVLGMVRSLT